MLIFIFLYGLISEPPDIRNWFSSYVYESPKVDTIEDFTIPDHEKDLDDKVYMNEYSGSGELQDLRNSLVTAFIHDDEYQHQSVSKVHLIYLVMYLNSPSLSFPSPVLQEIML